MKLTRSQRDALLWLEAHGGDGIFARGCVLLAAGEIAPFNRVTWNRLRDHGLVEMYKPTGKGFGRCRIVKRAA